MWYRSVLWGLVYCVVLYRSSTLGYVRHVTKTSWIEAASRPLQGKTAYLWPATPLSFRESPRRTCKPRTSTAAGIYSPISCSWEEQAQPAPELGKLPSGNSTQLLKIVKIVDLPIKNGDFPVRYVNVYQRVILPLSKKPEVWGTNAYRFGSAINESHRRRTSGRVASLER